MCDCLLPLSSPAPFSNPPLPHPSFFPTFPPRRWRSCDQYAPNGENQPEDAEGPEVAHADGRDGMFQRSSASPLSPHCSPNICAAAWPGAEGTKQQYRGVEGAVLGTPTHGGRRVWGSSRMVLASPKMQLASIEGDEEAVVSTREWVPSGEYQGSRGVLSAELYAGLPRTP